MAEKTPGKNKNGEENHLFEDLSKEELLKQARKQFLLLKKTKLKIDDLNKKCRSLEQKVVESELKNEKPVNDVSEGKLQLDELRDEKEKLEGDLKEANVIKEELVQKLNRNAEENECMQMKMGTLNSTCQHLQQELGSLQNKIQDQDKIIKDLSSENNVANSTIEDLYSQIDLFKDLKSRYKVLLADMEEMESERIQLLERISTEEVKNGQLNEDIKELDLRNEITAQEFMEIMHKYEEMKKNSSCSIESLNKEMAELKESSQNTIDELQLETESLKMAAEASENEKLELKTSLEALESETMDKVTEIGRLNENELKDRLLDAENVESKLTAELEGLQAEKEELQQEILQDRELIRFLEDEAKSLTEENKKVKSDMTKMEAEFDKDSQQIKEFELKIVEMQEREQSTLCELKELQNKFEEAEESRNVGVMEREIESLHGNVAELYEEVNKLELKLEAESNLKAQLEKDFNELRIDCEQLKAVDMKCSENELETKRGDYNQLVKAMRDLKSKSDLKLSSKGQELDELRVENKQLKTDLEAFVKNVCHLEDQLNRIQNEIHCKLEIIKDQKSRFEHLEADNKSKTDDINRLIKVEEDYAIVVLELEDLRKQFVPDNCDLDELKVDASVRHFEEELACKVKVIDDLTVRLTEVEQELEDARNEFELVVLKNKELVSKFESANNLEEEVIKLREEASSIENKLCAEFELRKELEVKIEELKAQNEELKTLQISTKNVESIEKEMACKIKVIDGLQDELEVKNKSLNRLIKYEKDYSEILPKFQLLVLEKEEADIELKTKVHELEVAAEKLETRNKELELKIEDDKITSGKNLESMEDEVGCKIRIIDDLKDELEEKKSRLYNLVMIEDNYTELLRKYELLTSENEVVDSLKEEINVLENKLKEEIGLKNKLDEELNGKCCELEELNIKNGSVKAQNTQLEARLEVDLEIYTKSVSNLENELACKIRVIAGLQDEIKTKDESLNRLLKAEEDLNELLPEINRLTSEKENSKCELNDKLKELRVDIEEISAQNIELKDKLEEKKGLISSLHDQLDRLLDKNEDLEASAKDELLSLRREVTCKVETIEGLESELVRLTKFEKDHQSVLDEMEVLKNTCQLESKLREELSLKADEFNGLRVENEELKSDVVRLTIVDEDHKNVLEEMVVLKNARQLENELQEELSLKADMLDGLRVENKELKSNIVKLTLVEEDHKNVLEEMVVLKNTRQLENELQKDLNLKADELNELKVANEELENANNDLEAKISHLKDNAVSELNVKTENLDELRCEFDLLASKKKTLDEELIERDQSLQAHKEQYLMLKKDFDSLFESENDLKCKVKDRDDLICELKNKVQGIGDQMAEDSVDSSKLKEAEEKIMKLKMIAVKAKRELVESKKKIVAISSEKDQLLTKINQINQDSNSSLTLLQNYQSLQSEYDKAQDEIDDEKIKSKKFEQDLQVLLHELANLKNKYSSLEEEKKKYLSENEKIQVEKANLFRGSKEFESKIATLETEKKKESKKYDALQNKHDALSTKFEDLTVRLKEEKKQHAASSGKLSSYLQESKKQNLIDLEIADYERTVSSLQTEIHVLNGNIEEFKSDNEHLKGKISSLQDEIECLEVQKSEIEDHSMGLKELLEKSKKEVIELKECHDCDDRKIDDLKHQLEKSSQQIEDHKVQTSELLAQKRNLEDAVLTMKENHKTAIKNSDAKILMLQNNLKMVEKEKENNQRDYECYKTRVHSVYKQQKLQSNNTQDESKEAEIRLQEIVDNLQSKLDGISSKLIAAKSDNEALQMEYDLALKRNTQLTQNVETTRCDLHNQIQNLMKEKNQLIFENKEIILCLQTENGRLTSNNKNQIEFESNQKQIISRLEKEICTKEEEIKRLQREKLTESSLRLTNSKDEENVDISLQERQEGEGSECAEVYKTSPQKVSSLPLIHSTGFTPFEQLIQNPDLPSSPSPSVNSSNADPEVLSNLLASSTKKIEHLSEVLKEAEEGNTRLSEQTKVLKNEIRRLERNKEREEHSKNLEYMKNVILKYLILPGGDEKLRLIPVLTTMLRLSPEEKKYLEDAAGGDIADGSLNSEGWGGLLHRWSGLS